QLFAPPIPPTPFHHIALNVDAATQAGIEARLKAAGFAEPQMYILEHGYCRSVYAQDPNGMICEFTCDHPDAERINEENRRSAHAELKRWLAGDHHNNNPFRTEAH